MNVTITDTQRQRLKNLFIIYGVGGIRYTLGNHRFLQSLILHDYYNEMELPENFLFRGLYKPVTTDCKQKVHEILEL